MSTRSTRFAAAAAGALVIAGLTAVPPAEARDGDIRVRGACSGSSEWKLKLGPRSGGIETELEVDSDVVGQVWSVTITDNGASVFSGSRTTVAPSGSFTVRTRITDRPGTDTVVATASNAATGESCTGSASV